MSFYVFRIRMLNYLKGFTCVDVPMVALLLSPTGVGVNTGEGRVSGSPLVVKIVVVMSTQDRQDLKGHLL